ncbi:MAG: C40 family peptidase [Bacteroidales bacterium]|nr:C40 family peptidase [Bacteroidales bacterium]
MKRLIEQIQRQSILLAVIMIGVLMACKPREEEKGMKVEEPYGLVTVSVCNMRQSPAHNTELISQAVMGTPVKILRLQPGWYYIQTPESYEGWVDSQAIKTLGPEETEAWKRSDRLIYMNKYGDIYADTTTMLPVADIVAGSIVELSEVINDYCRIILPDGREGYISRNEAVKFDEWLENIHPDEQNLRRWAESFTGLPYLWGGTSPKAFDCSGFVKTVYYLNGVILERDASQQFAHGIKLSIEAYPDSLRIGDLLFFGYVRDGSPRPTHVGMYIGATEFIHASGMVKINSLDSSRSNFSRGRRNAFLGVRRIIGTDPGEGLQAVSSHPWYN